MTNSTEIKVLQYNNINDDGWDNFVRNDSRNGGIFNERKFLSYHQKGKFNDSSLLFYKDNIIYGVFPSAIIYDNGRPVIVSHPGSSCGGLIFHKKAKTKDVLSMLEKMIYHYQRFNYHSIEMRLAEPIFDKLPSDELRYLLWHRGFKLTSKEISTCVKLDKEKSWLLNGRKKNTTDINNLIRQGFEFKLTENIDEVYPMIKTNLGQKYQKSPTHTYDELKLLKTLYPENINMWVVMFESKTVCTAVSFIVNNIAVHDFYIAQNYDFSKFNVMPLMFYNIFEYYYSKGYSWYNFGISSRGDEIKWGMLEFKERMGGRATSREVYLLEDLNNYKQYNLNVR